MIEYINFIETLTNKGYKQYKFNLQEIKDIERRFWKSTPEALAKKVLLAKKKFNRTLATCLEVKICPVCGEDIAFRSFEREAPLSEVIVENTVSYCTSCKLILDTTEKIIQ